MKTVSQQIFSKRLLTGVCILFLLGSPISGQEQYNFNRRTVNWGFKVGLNANAVRYLSGVRGEEKLNNLSFRNRTGVTTTGFLRINFERFFIQPEVSWNTLDKNILFSLSSEESSTQVIELSFKTQTVNASGLIGYNITKTGPFLFNVYAGTSLHYKYDARYTILPSKSEYYDFNPGRNAFGVVGFSMNIANAHFDIRYALGILPTDIDFNQIAYKPDRLEGVILHKGENLLGFSFGVMF
jgi:hypothetical protein